MDGSSDAGGHEWSPTVRRKLRGQPFHSVEGRKAGTFSLVTYNSLADFYISQTDFLSDEKYLFRGTSPESARHKILVAEVKSLAGDVLCLQEVDVGYFDLLEEQISALGYRGRFFQKKLGFKDGVATFFKESKFELVSSRMVVLADLIESLGCSTRGLPHVLLMVALKHLETGRVLAVGNVHTVWEGLLCTVTQALQIAVTTQALHSFVESLSEDETKVPYVLCGDFNIEPHFPAYKILSDGALRGEDAEMIRDVKYIEWDPAPSQVSENELALLDGWHEHFTSPLKSIRSAYKSVLGAEPAFTCSSLVRLQTLDYIWFSSHNLKPHAVLELPAEEDVQPIGSVPNARFSSDHFPLEAYFEFC